MATAASRKKMEVNTASEVNRPRGLFFEEFEIGRSYFTPRRTVTHADITAFCGISGDFNAPHADWEFCKTQPYGEPIAHGPLILAIASGLQCQSRINDGTVIAMLGMERWNLLVPVKHGDTIHVQIIPREKRLTSDGRRGIIQFERNVLNQRAEKVQTMISSAMYMCRPVG